MIIPVLRFNPWLLFVPMDCVVVSRVNRGILRKNGGNFAQLDQNYGKENTNVVLDCDSPGLYLEIEGQLLPKRRNSQTKLWLLGKHHCHRGLDTIYDPIKSSSSKCGRWGLNTGCGLPNYQNNHSYYDFPTKEQTRCKGGTKNRPL